MATFGATQGILEGTARELLRYYRATLGAPQENFGTQKANFEGNFGDTIVQL